jgi:putative membrane protein
MKYLGKMSVQKLALFIALLFHFSGAVGMLLTPFRQWFIDMSALNLLLMSILVISTQVDKSWSFFLFAALTFLVGMTVEMIGVNTGLLFGNYSYGDTLGRKINGVPLLIGVNWFVVILTTGYTTYYVEQWLWKRAMQTTTMPSYVKYISFVFDAAFITVFFDWLLEPVATRLGYWHWEAGKIPFYNYLCWFIISAFLLTIFTIAPFKKDNIFAVHLLIIQMLFFLFLNSFL